MGNFFKGVANIFTGGKKKEKKTKTPTTAKTPTKPGPPLGGGAYGTTGSLLGTSIVGTTDEATTGRTLLGG
jgi:hypothetical protein